MSAILVEIRGVPGRVSLASKSGPVLSTTAWQSFPWSPWIQRAADRWGDIEIKPASAKKLPPVEIAIAEGPTAPAEKS